MVGGLVKKLCALCDAEFDISDDDPSVALDDQLCPRCLVGLENEYIVI